MKIANSFYFKKELHQTVVSLRNSATPVVEIARQTRQPVGYVLNILKKFQEELIEPVTEHELAVLKEQTVDIEPRTSLPANDVVALKEVGWGKDQIASVFGCTALEVQTVLKKHCAETGTTYGYIRRTLPYPSKQIASLRSSGSTVAEIANEMNSTIVETIIGLNVLERHQHGYSKRS